MPRSKEQDPRRSTVVVRESAANRVDKQRQAETMRFAIAPCSLGLVLLARSDVGVTAVFLGDDHEALRAALHDRFPHVELTDGDAATELLASEVVRIVDSPAAGIATLTASLDLRGSDFQRKVWKALREIPAGSTSTYTDVAIRIGRPKSVRAVAQACGANPVSVIVPCHRVVRRDGQLAGYYWGIERKRALLALEASA